MRSNLVDVNELFVLAVGLHLTLSAANRFSLVCQCNFGTCLTTPKNKQVLLWLVQVLVAVNDSASGEKHG